jgi:gamma-glutamyl hercynylcysteine S-oxide synthase
MKKVQDYLENEESDYNNDEISYRKCKTVWFQAWKYDKEDEILAALIEEIFKTMAGDNFFEKCRGRIAGLAKTFNKGKALGTLTKLLTGVNISEFFSELEYKDRLGFYNIFSEYFDELLWTYLSWREAKKDKEEKFEAENDKKSALVIFIDDLDRCPRERVIKVLETIKLFMDKKGCIFVIGAANDIIVKAIEQSGNYDREDAKKFMDKIVQVTFNLPQISEEKFDNFIKNLHLDRKAKLVPYLDLILPALEKNPRQVKRFLNNLSLQEGILEEKKEKIKIEFNHLLIWMIIEYAHPALYNDIIQQGITLLKQIKAEYEINKDKEKQITKEDRELTKAQKYALRSNIVKIIEKFDCDETQLEQLITMSQITQFVEDKNLKKEISEIGSMVKIPAGEFKYGDNKDEEMIKTPYEIDSYPVTNKQYEKFIEKGGYKKDEYWSEEGRKWKIEKKKTKPKYWDDERFNAPKQPVVGVSFYEAEAYAKWAGKRLPTEKEWERAARGTDGREYPWGNEFDKEKCNCSESGHGKTTNVTLYKNGVSPEGCYDMAGNVWEWTSSFYYKDKGSDRVFRGGSWLQCAELPCGLPLLRQPREPPQLYRLPLGFSPLSQFVVHLSYACEQNELFKLSKQRFGTKRKA